MPWIREGACPPERCGGKCCEHFGLWFDRDEDSKRFLAMLQLRGVRILEGPGDKYLADIPAPCKYLREGLCTLHPDMAPGPDMPPRPDLCDEWPTEPGQTVGDPHCGFTFRWENDENVLRAGESPAAGG